MSDSAPGWLRALLPEGPSEEVAMAPIGKHEPLGASLLSQTLWSAPPNALRQLRRAKRMNLEPVGTVLGVSGATIWRWENGRPKSVPNVAQAAVLAELYGVTVEEIATMFRGHDEAAV